MTYILFISFGILQCVNIYSIGKSALCIMPMDGIMPTDRWTGKLGFDWIGQLCVSSSDSFVGHISHAGPPS